MATEKYEDVLRFWFPLQPNTDRAAMVRQWEWWFRGGGNVEIIEHFSPLLEQAIRGELDAWSRQPRSRLALILVLDQFSHSIYQDTAQAFAQGSKACKLTLDGINNRSENKTSKKGIAEVRVLIRKAMRTLSLVVLG